MISDDQMSDFVLKQSVLPLDNNDVNHLINAEILAKNQREALIMERLSSSPRIVNIYGHCGTSVVAEAGDDSVAKAIVPDSGIANRTVLEQLPFIPSFNTYTPIEKLDLALEMSKAIADIHGFAGGIIVHGDIHPVQWLLSRNKRTVQLNDFNNAEILRVKRRPTKLGNKTFCKADRGTWIGTFRSPEEYLGDRLDEKVDVYSMGNMIYSILTGLVRTGTTMQVQIKDSCQKAVYLTYAPLLLSVHDCRVWFKQSLSGLFMMSRTTTSLKKSCFILNAHT